MKAHPENLEKHQSIFDTQLAVEPTYIKVSTLFSQPPQQYRKNKAAFLGRSQTQKSMVASGLCGT